MQPFIFYSVYYDSTKPNITTMKPLIITFLSLIIFTTAQAQKRDIKVSSFSELALGIPANLYLKQGSNEKVTITCDDDIFEKIEFEVKGDKLTIKKEYDGNRWKSGWGSSEVDIYVTMRTIEALSMSGSGNIESEGTLKVDDLALAISGSGDIDLKVSGDELDARISGSGSIQLAGTANEASGRISGSGKVKAEGLTVDSFEARISGSGSCYITVTESIEASISGSGNVYYAGTPARVNSNSSGSGKIKKM